MNRIDLMAIMRGRDRSLRGSTLRCVLAIIEPGYRAVVAVRNAMFNTGLRKPARADRPVISIGNLTTGGTGKTPMVIEVCRRLLALGHVPAVLLRGYRASDGVSDEAQELRSELGADVAIEVGACRVASSQRVLKRFPEVSVFVLDDGFQHRQLARDLDIVLVDATDPFGGDRLLPRGLLREPVSALKRANAVIVTRTAGSSPALDQRVRDLTGRTPLAHAAHQWTAFRCGPEDQRLPIDALAGQTVLGVCGIANPEAFEADLVLAVGKPVNVIRFEDHFAYTPAVLRDLAMKASTSEAMVTTEKDWMKWRPLLEEARFTVPVYRPVLRMKFLDGSEALDALLCKIKPLTA